jgi:hypothetical protein
MKSDGNNFLTTQSSAGTFSMTDGGLNVVTNINDHLRIGAQAYSRNIGRIGNGHVQLDWGYADYRVKDWLGFRGGKVKSTLGLYNDTQDVDAPARLGDTAAECLSSRFAESVYLACGR